MTSRNQDEVVGCMVWLMVGCISVGVGTWNTGLGLVTLGVFIFIIMILARP